jgi:uncharacterized protein YcsI (UPF0317 family)
VTGFEARRLVRTKQHRGPTAELAPGFVQANLVAVPAADAGDFRLLCARNPVPCPLLDETAPGTVTSSLASGSDLRTDLPAYRLWRDGDLVDRLDDAREIWRDDLVAFLIGCSYTFEWALTEAGLPSRHARCGLNVPMYRTNVPLAPAGRLHGHMVVSMRPYPESEIDRVRAVTRPFVEAHGEPFAWGDPGQLGIRDQSQPEEGDAVPFEPGEVAVFWGCGVTPQVVAVESRLPYVITHEPGHMFVTDRRHEDLRRAELD